MQAGPKHAILRKASGVFLDGYLQRFVGIGGELLDGADAVLSDVAVSQ